VLRLHDKAQFMREVFDDLAETHRVPGGWAGGRLLAKVCELAIGLSRDVGCVGLVVDAKEAARGFYERYDFVWLPAPVAEGVTRGFLPIQTIEAALNL
jgi:hypothetical protein